MDEQVDPAAPGSNRTTVVQINQVDLAVVRRFFDTVFHDIPEDLMDAWFEILRRRPTAAFNEALMKVNKMPGSVGTREFTLMMVGVALAHGSSDPTMTRGFDISDKIQNATKGATQ